MDQFAGIVSDTGLNPIDYFRMRAQEATSIRTRDNLMYAVDALSLFAGGSEMTFDGFTEQMVGGWVSSLLFQGYSPKTISNNVLKRIATLYNKAVDDGLARPTDIFRDFQNSLNASAIELSFAGAPDLYGKLSAVVKREFSKDARMRLARDILLFSIYMGGMSFEDIVDYKKDDWTGDSGAIAEIVGRYSRPRNKYLFPLDRSNATGRKLVAEVRGLFKDIMGICGIGLPSMASDVSFSLWAYIAMSCGVAPSDVSACICPHNRRVPVTAFVRPSELSGERIEDIRRQVESALNDNPARWYAMKLRPRVAFGDVENRIGNLDGHVARPEFFYPYDEICRRVGKKISKDKQPVIRDIVFFKLRVTDIFPLFCNIGDLAWCYTTTGRPGGDYAPIPKASFERFQETIGRFTPEYEVAPIGGFEPEEGQSVVMVNGPLSSYEFEIDKAREDSGNVIFQLNMIGNNGFQWRTNAKKRQIEPTIAK